VESAKTRTLGPRLAVGFSLGGVFLLSLLHPLAFTLLVALASGFAAAELARAMRQASAKQTLRDFGGTAFVLVYVPVLLSFAIQLVDIPGGRAWVLGMVLTVVAIDTFGYLIGRFFGKTKLSPEISPKKTWEGLGASIVGAIVGGQLLVLLTPASFWFGLLFGAAILMSSVLGDLSESLLKRDLNVKDMGTVLPGHGGVLDRIDSLIPSSFVAFLLSQMVF